MFSRSMIYVRNQMKGYVVGMQIVSESWVRKELGEGYVVMQDFMDYFKYFGVQFKSDMRLLGFKYGSDMIKFIF